MAAAGTSHMQPGSTEEGGAFSRVAGGMQTTKETFVDLHEHSIRLGHLARWDRAAPLLALGTLLLGAGIGAWAAGKGLTDAKVLGCLAGGAGLLAGGLVLREERVKSARDLHREFEGRLALYDDDPRVQTIRERYKQKEREAFDRTILGLTIRAFRAFRRYRLEKVRVKSDT